MRNLVQAPSLGRKMFKLLSFLILNIKINPHPDPPTFAEAGCYLPEVVTLKIACSDYDLRNIF